MAYYSRRNGYGGRYPRRYRRTTTRSGYYSGKKYTQKGRKPATKGRATLVKLVQKAKKQMEQSAMVSRHGEPVKLDLYGLPGAVQAISQPGHHYFVVPIAEPLRALARMGNPRRSLYVTGVSLELDVFHPCPMDFFAICGSVTASRDMPEVWTQMSAEKCEFALADYGMEKKGARSGLWSSQQDYVARLSQVFFEGQGRDGSLFTAPVNKNANIVSGTSKLNKKHHATHQSKVSLDLIRKGEPHSMVDGGLVRDTIHLWWGINKEVTLADSAGNYIGDHYSILCGLRAQADLQQPEVSGGKSPIPQANAQAVRVTLYVRRK